MTREICTEERMALTSSRAAASAKASSRSERRPSISLSISCSIACIWLFSVSQTCCSVRSGSGYTDGSAATTILHNARVEHRDAQGILDSELTSHRDRCNQPSRARSECERVPRRNSRRARAQASSRYHQSAAQRGYERSTKHDVYLGVGQYLVLVRALGGFHAGGGHGTRAGAQPPSAWCLAAAAILGRRPSWFQADEKNARL